MEALVPIFVWISLILSGLGILAIALFGLKSLANGKINTVTVIIVSVPVALFVILGLVLDTWALAGIWTSLLTLVLASVSLLISGARGIIN